MKSRCLKDLKRKKSKEKKEHANKVGVSASLSLCLVRVCTEKPTESIYLFFSLIYFITKKENDEGKGEGMRLAERRKGRTSSIDAEGRRKRREEREYRVGIMNQKINPSTTSQNDEVTFWSYLCFFFLCLHQSHRHEGNTHFTHVTFTLDRQREKKTMGGGGETVIREERKRQRETTVGLVHLRCCVVNQCQTERRIS